MAWIRLDDQITHHPKILRVGLSAWFYVGCIGYAQRFLTDGYVPQGAILTLCGGVSKPQHHINKLVTAGLLQRVNGGYQIHDYLDFNDSAVVVKAKREADRNRKDSSRIPIGIQTESARNPESVLARAPASHPIPSHPITEDQLENKLARNVVAATTSGNGSNGKHAVTARSKRPIFSGQRIVVFEWMLDDMTRTLGPHTDAFDLHAWFFDLDARAVKNNIVIPRKESWQWLQAALEQEARSRGLPFGDKTHGTTAKTAGNAAALKRFAERRI